MFHLVIANPQVHVLHVKLAPLWFSVVYYLPRNRDFMPWQKPNQTAVMSWHRGDSVNVSDVNLCYSDRHPYKIVDYTCLYNK